MFIRKIYGLVLAGATLMVSPVSPAHAQADGCKTVNLPAGSGFKLTKECFAETKPEGSESAYYKVSFQVKPRKGFEQNSRFRANGVFKNFLDVLTGSKKTKNVTFTVSLEFGNISYNDIPLLAFQKEGDDWVSSVGGAVQSKFFKLATSNSISIKPRYFYSKEKSVNLNSFPDILQNSGIDVASASTKKFFDIANNFTNAIISQDNVRAVSTYQTLLGNNPERRHSVAFQIGNPSNPSEIFADVTMTLEGTRSLFMDAKSYTKIGTTLPSGVLASSAVDDLAKRISADDIVNASVGQTLATTSLSAIPLSRAPTESEIRGFCNAMNIGLSGKYALSEFDSLMLRASVLNNVTLPVKDKIDRFRACFNKSEVDLIKKHLGIGPAPAPTSRPPTSAEIEARMLADLAIFFKTQDKRERQKHGDSLFQSPHQYLDSGQIGPLVDDNEQPIRSQSMLSAATWSTMQPDDDKALAKNIGCYVFPRDDASLPKNSAYALGNFVSQSVGDLLVPEENEALIKLTFSSVGVQSDVGTKVSKIELVAEPDLELISSVKNKFNRCGTRRDPWNPTLLAR